MLARKVGGKEAGGVAIGSQIDELRHAALNFGSNLLELADIADRRVKAAQALKSILSHLVEAGSADAQDGVKQRSALQAQGAQVDSYGMCGASADAWLERTTVSCGRGETSLKMTSSPRTNISTPNTPRPPRAEVISSAIFCA